MRIGTRDVMCCDLSWTLTCNFSDAIIDQANWDSSKLRDKLRRDMDAHVASVRVAKLSELTTVYEVTTFCNLPLTSGVTIDLLMCVTTLPSSITKLMCVSTVNRYLCNHAIDERKSG